MRRDSGEVHAAVRRLLEARPQASLAEVASLLEMSQRTLQRHLRERGDSYRQVRLGVVEYRLLDLRGRRPPLSKKEIAFELGFSSPSAFSHFERRLSR